MNVVYAVLVHYDYEGFTVEAVFDNRAAAEALCAALVVADHGAAVTVKEWPVRSDAVELVAAVEAE